MFVHINNVVFLLQSQLFLLLPDNSLHTNLCILLTILNDNQLLVCEKKIFNGIYHAD